MMTRNDRLMVKGAKDLCDSYPDPFCWRQGVTSEEVRLVAHMRSLLGCIEGIKGKSTVERMWINQPSRLQPYYHLHGTRVLAVRESEVTYQIYFLDGDVISQQIDPLALSKGWR